jgi:hypothetical protein
VFQSLCKFLSLVLLCWLVNIEPASAEFCRQVDSHRICILNIKRSAKNYWQYQAVVSTDGITQPQASYDCRDRLITDRDGYMSSFRSRPDGAIVCTTYRR